MTKSYESRRIYNTLYKMYIRGQRAYNIKTSEPELPWNTIAKRLGSSGSALKRNANAYAEKEGLPRIE